jgi:hypothetical protein
MVGTCCCMSATEDPRRTPSTVSLPEQICPSRIQTTNIENWSLFVSMLQNAHPKKLAWAAAPAYSWRNASIGSTLAALLAGP